MILMIFCYCILYFDIRKNPGNVVAYIRHFSKSCFSSIFDCKTNMVGFLVFGVSLMYFVSYFFFPLNSRSPSYPHHHLPGDITLPQIHPGSKAKNLINLFSLRYEDTTVIIIGASI